LSYLLKEWGVIATEKFYTRTFHLLELLSELPEIGLNENPEKGIYSFLISKQIRIFYQFTSTQLIVLHLFDVRQNPTKRPI